MPIIIKTKNNKEYVVAGDYTLDQFTKNFMTTDKQYIKFDAEDNNEIIPTSITLENIDEIQEITKKEQEEKEEDYSFKSFYN